MGVLEPGPVLPRIDLADEPDFELGGLKVMPAQCAVEMNCERRKLQPRMMHVLVALASAGPAVVSRDRLIERCWDGRVVGDDALNRVILALRHLAQEFTPRPFVIETVPRIGHRLVEAGPASSVSQRRSVRFRPLIVAAVLLALLLVGGLIRAWPWRAPPESPTVLVTYAADDPDSREIARDLAVRLASLETARSTSLRLINDVGSLSGDQSLILEVAKLADSTEIGAGLLLRSAADRSILWSEELKQPSGDSADLMQQVALRAGAVLGCAAEALSPGGGRLSEQAVKLYLNGCAAMAELAGREAEGVIPIFREVLRAAPEFEGAWAKLLFADVDVFLEAETSGSRSRLEADLEGARKVNPDLPEAFLAETYLLPANAYSERMRLVNRAIEVEPENSDAHAIRATALQLVGRMKDSIVEARRAMQLDPLSPSARNDYVFALANAGFYDIARQELREAERLWPGTSSIADTRFAFNLRFGDPGEALEYLRANPSADWMNAKSYLEARADRIPAKIDLAIRDAETLYERRPRTLQHLVQVYGEFDRNQKLLELLLKAPKTELALIDMAFRAPSIDFWRDPRSLRVAERAGLLDYWRLSDQWPDFCFSADLRYDCKAEAAKIAGAGKA